MTFDQRKYWDSVAEQKSFTHPLQIDWLREQLEPTGRVLDYGCGYGRLCAELGQLGFHSVVGLDFSPRMIERARRQLPEIEFHVDSELESDSILGLFDALLMFSIWTCNPEDEALDGLMSRSKRLLKPGGLLYVSDLLLQEDARNRERYEASASGPWGCFELPEGARLRHFDEDGVRRLVQGFDPLRFEPLEVTTMNGNRARAFQYLGRRQA